MRVVINFFGAAPHVTYRPAQAQCVLRMRATLKSWEEPGRWRKGITAQNGGSNVLRPFSDSV